MFPILLLILAVGLLWLPIGVLGLVARRKPRVVRYTGAAVGIYASLILLVALFVSGQYVSAALFALVGAAAGVAMLRHTRKSRLE